MEKARIVIQGIQDVTVVDFAEPSILEAYQIDEISRQISKVLQADEPEKLLLDFTKVRHLSSQALGMLLDVRKKCTAAKTDLLLCGLQKDILRVFKLTKLDKVFTFKDTPRDALAHFGVSIE